MSTIEKRMKLAKEAVELIQEFKVEASILGCSAFVEASIEDEGYTIKVEDEFDEREYFLIDISSVFSDEMVGWGPCSPSFYEGIGLAEAELESNFNKLSKDEFKEYVGNLKYAEYRCEAIYKRLEEIEEEASKL